VCPPPSIHRGNRRGPFEAYLHDDDDGDYDDDNGDDDNCDDVRMMMMTILIQKIFAELQ
jgi:hypothetical protein